MYAITCDRESLDHFVSGVLIIYVSIIQDIREIKVERKRKDKKLGDKEGVKRRERKGN